MKTCIKCNHKFSGNNCPECKKEYRKNNKDKVAKWQKTDYEKNKEKRIAYISEWKRKNKEKVHASYERNKYKHIESQKIYREKNKDKRKIAIKKWLEVNREEVNFKRRERYKKNKEKEKEQMRAYRKANPDKIKHISKICGKAWRENNKEYGRVACINRRAKKRLAGGKHTAEDIKNLLYLQNCKCICCKKNIKNNYHVDHIIPIAKGGSNDKYNLQLLCPACNLQKSAKHPIDFMQEKGFLL